VPYGENRLFNTIEKVYYVGVPRSRYPKHDFIQTIKLFFEAWRVRTNIVICFELRTLIMGLILKFFKRVKLIYDCHEYRPERYSTFFPRFLSNIAINFLMKFEKLLANNSDFLWCVNMHLSDRLRPGRNHVIVLPNYPKNDFISNSEKLPVKILQRFNKKKIIIYAGGISESRGITACLFMISYLRHSIPNVYCIFLGTVSPIYKKKIDTIIKELSIENYVEFLGYIDYKDIPSYLLIGHIGIFIILPVKERYYWGEPIKYFEYSAAKLPVVMSDLPAKRALIDKYQNGILVNPYDYKETALRIAKLLKNDSLRKEMSDRGYYAFITKLNWNKIEAEMLNSIRNLF
jgi:glycosyltransferase involved in cell wall biosynthesis